MNGQEKLREAVEKTIAAGYQLDKGAFDFLCTAADTEDPRILMNKVLQRMDNLQEKPSFINRSLLEVAIEPPNLIEESQVAFPKRVLNNSLTVQETQMNHDAFHFCAKDIEAEIRVIEDPTAKLSSNGTMEEFLNFFQDRFRRIERLLRQRIDVRSATPIREALKSPAKAKLKIICMITGKREAKQKIILTVEDLDSSAIILISRKSTEDLRRKAQLLLPDQVVCISVIKTRSELFLAEDIIFPEIGQKPNRRASEPVYAVLTSDIHVGSSKFNREAFDRFILWLNGKYGNERMREIASYVKYILVAGDLVDGVGVYPNQMKELVLKDVYKQHNLALKLIEKIPRHIEILVSPGNHDTPRKALPQPAISNDFLKNLQNPERFHSLGNPTIVSIHNVEILMYHGRSLDDIIATVPGLNHSHPEKAMKLLLQSRHLAPIYGGKTMLSPESRDFLVIDQIPDIFHAGHVHVTGICNYRGVLVINSGGWQEQTDYMQKLGLVPTPGIVPVVNLQTLKTSVLSFA